MELFDILLFLLVIATGIAMGYVLILKLNNLLEKKYRKKLIFAVFFIPFLHIFIIISIVIQPHWEPLLYHAGTFLFLIINILASLVTSQYLYRIIDHLINKPGHGK